LVNDDGLPGSQSAAWRQKAAEHNTGREQKQRLDRVFREALSTCFQETLIYSV
jgi:hypothetical protein